MHSTCFDRRTVGTARVLGALLSISLAAICMDQCAGSGLGGAKKRNEIDDHDDDIVITVNVTGTVGAVDRRTSDIKVDGDSIENSDQLSGSIAANTDVSDSELDWSVSRSSAFLDGECTNEATFNGKLTVSIKSASHDITSVTFRQAFKSKLETPIIKWSAKSPVRLLQPGQLTTFDLTVKSRAAGFANVASDIRNSIAWEDEPD
jgi:hypothetical protein